MTTILIKKKDTTGAPAPGDLTNAAGGAEIAVNTSDLKIYTKNSGGAIVQVGSGPSATDTLTNKSISGSTNTITNVSLTTGVTGTLPVANGGTGITSFGAGVATFLGTPSSANLAAAVTDETGSGALVFATSPTLVTPALGTPASGVVTNLTGTASININGTVGATTPNTGSFTVLTENAFPVVTQTDVGTAPNQLPLNQYLGDLAYQDADAIAGPVGVGGTITSDTNLAAPLANVNGVVFPATQVASANANTLDDYEEGTWTPTITEAGTDRSPTYSTRGGKYTKIGNRVFCTFGFLLTNKGSGSGSGQVRIGGLPFSAASQASYQEATTKMFAGGFTTATTTNASFQVFSGTQARLWLADNSAPVATIVPYTEITNNTFINAEFFYDV
jgi:hypothetical protein